ncbi:hypothetical protein BGZ91_006078, partial [Linnemannia elongata]
TISMSMSPMSLPKSLEAQSDNPTFSIPSLTTLKTLTPTTTARPRSGLPSVSTIPFMRLSKVSSLVLS